MADNYPQFRLRMPAGLKEFVRQSAEKNQRSLNGEIVFALSQYQKAASDPKA